jgi:hypothetical protein
VLVIESEFARVLHAIERTGNTLSPVVRDAWDGKPLGVMTKTKAAQCKEPHVSMIGHCTTDELRRLLADVSIANGFANRFLFVCVKRSKLLPHGGDKVDLSNMQVDLRSAINHARRTGELPFDSAGREYWADAYIDISTRPRRGLFGNVTTRGDAQVRRLACIYALLDEEVYVPRPALGGGARRVALLRGERGVHLRPDNRRSNRGRDPVGAADPAGGMTRTEIIHLFGRHKSAEEIGRALGVLLEDGQSEEPDRADRRATVGTVVRLLSVRIKRSKRTKYPMPYFAYFAYFADWRSKTGEGDISLTSLNSPVDRNRKYHARETAHRR